MRTLLFVLGILAFLLGLGVMAESKSAVHEILAVMLMLICAVLISGASIVGSINSLRKDLVSRSG